MATSSKAKISIETGQTLTAYAKMTDGGDHQVFNFGTIWSGKSGFTPEVRPNGMVSGRNVLSVHATDDTITVAGFTAYSKGTEHTVTATTDTFSRGTGPGKAKIISVVMDSTGTIAVVHGAEGADTTFSETRDAAGGPPYMPVGNVEIGQIRTTVSTAQAVTAAEIFQVVGTHAERFDYPTWDEFNIGKGILADTAAEKQSHVKLASALPAIHTAAAYKDVYVQYYTPVFSELAKTMDFSPAENSPSVSSSQYYNGTIAAASRSLGTGGFTALMTDNISDALLNEQDEVITVKFWPDRNKNPYVLTQGEIGVARTYPVAAQNQVAVTIAAENASVSFLS
jgi:hypothetical protein